MKFIVFGDSICCGQFVSPHLIWVNQLSAFLHNRIPNFWLNNPSISGNTTRMALERMPFDVQAHGIDVFYTQFGMNDCNFWNTDQGLSRVSKSAFKQNLVEVIERARNFGATKVFIGTNHPTPKITNFDGLDFSYQDSNKIYNNLIREVAIESDAILVDHESAWNEQIRDIEDLKRHLLKDQIHLSVSGHKLYFDLFMKVLENHLLN